jgi:hypothetical protein
VALGNGRDAAETDHAMATLREQLLEGRTKQPNLTALVQEPNDLLQQVGVIEAEACGRPGHCGCVVE